MVRHFGSSACFAGAILVLATLASAALADEDETYHHNYIYGVPANPGAAWTLAVGGRLYDHWADVLDTELPDETHPLWPATNTAHEGGSTWRCKACHGWDYQGAAGKYASGSWATGIKGVTGMAGADIAKIVTLLGDADHGYTDALIPADAKLRLATFISRGLDDVSAYVALDGTVKGDPAAGRDIFQNVCASCHGFEGRALDWGEPGDPAYVGTEANDNPWEVFHKIRNGHPGTEMISLRGFGPEAAANVLAYAQSLPVD